MSYGHSLHVILLLLILNTVIKAIEIPDTNLTEAIEYEIMPDDAYDHNDYFYKLHSLREVRININTCTLQKLLSIPTISFGTASAIIEYRENSGQIFSLRELFTVPNSDSTEIAALIPYIRTGFEPAAGKQKYADVTSPHRVSLISRAINPSEMADTYGSGIKAMKIYNALHARYDDSISVGMCTEKDAGEKNIADYKSFYFRYNNLWGTEYILLGDFLAEFGKGLLVWAPFRQMSTINASNPQLGFGIGIREHSGTSESLFMRGAAFGFRYNYFLMEYFFSHRSIDASFDSTGSYISYISLSGYHRSRLEIARQSSANENIAGTILTFSNFHSYEVKLLLLYDSYSVPILQKLNLPQRAISGSISYAFKRKAIFINGEIAHSNHKSGHITNISISPVATSTMIMSYRRYEPSFLGMHSSVFMHNDQTSNGEEGFYSGLHLTYGKCSVDSHADFFRTLGADRFGLCYNGNEFFGSFLYKNSNTITHKLGVKYSKNENPVTGSLCIIKGSTANLLTWYDFEYKPTQSLVLKSRIGIIRNQDSVSHQGFLTYMHINCRVNQTMWISGRAYFYKTDDYSSGLFTSEGEVPGYVTTARLYNDGVRYFLAVTTVLLQHVHLSLKAALQRNETLYTKKYFSQYSLQCELRY